MNIIVKQISRFLYHITKISYFRNVYKCAQGTNNKVIIVENGKEKVLPALFYLKGIVITFAGSNNVITIKKPFNFKNSRIHFHGSDSQMIFNENISGSWQIEAYKIRTFWKWAKILLVVMFRLFCMAMRLRLVKGA